MNISSDNISGVKNLPGVNLTSCIVPCTDEDNYATHDSTYGKGGWREVATIEERNAIPLERRKLGMAVYVTQTNKLYILKYAFNDACWYEFNSTDVSDIINAAIDAGKIDIDIASCVSYRDLERALGDYNNSSVEASNIAAAVSESAQALRTWVEQQNFLTEHQSLEGLATEAFVQESIGDAVAEIEDNLVLLQGDVADLKIDSQELKDFKGEATDKFDLIDSNLATINEFISGGSESEIEVATKASVDELAAKEEEDYSLLRDNISVIAETYATKDEVATVNTALGDLAVSISDIYATKNEVAAAFDSADYVTKAFLRGFATESFVKDYVARVMDGTVKPGNDLVDYAAEIEALKEQVRVLTEQLNALQG